ncbi:MAG: hypothetical protein QP758_01745 [Actinotignum timonense]|uniref:hypothetical protein n=1 Tax=Actinotignum TaxID=1653174 RepID=UPI00254E8F06|nr:hypothetical protein [Actinotignum timonense]MDK8283207.1 hypothetical protein [Actinotignum timonense]
MRLLEREYASLLLEKRALETECETLRNSHAIDEHESDYLVAQLDGLQASLESAQRAATQAEEQRDGLELEVRQVRQEYSDLQAAYASERTVWEEQVAAHNLALQQAQAASSALETELAAARNELDAAQLRVGELEEQNRALQQSLGDAEVTREALTACQQDLAQAKEENEKLKTANSGLAGQLEQAQVQVSVLSRRLEEETTRAKALETQQGEGREKLSDALFQLKQTQTALVEKTTALQQAEQDLATERDAHAAERQELEALRREIEEGTQEGEQAEAMRLELAQAREEQTRLSQVLDERVEYAQTLEADKDRLKRERNTVAGQVRDLHTELTAAELALEKAKMREAEQTRILEDLRAENQRLSNQLRSARLTDTVSLPVVQRPPTTPPAEENATSGDDKEGDRRSRVLKFLAAIVALVLALAAGYLAHLLLTSTDDVADPSPVVPSVTATPHPRSTPSEAPSPALPATPAVPAPPADTAPPPPPVSEGGSAPQGGHEEPVERQPGYQPPVEEVPAPVPAPEPAPVPEPAFVTDLSAGATSSGRSVTISANVSTTGAVPVSVYATVGGRSLSLGSQTVAGSGSFEASITMEPGTYSWSVSADGLVNSGTITVY